MLRVPLIDIIRAVLTLSKELTFSIDLLSTNRRPASKHLDIAWIAHQGHLILL